MATKRWVRITLKGIAGLFLLVVIAWMAAAYYINHNNKKVLQTILTQLNSKVNGRVEVGAMETTLLKGFPGVSVSLKNVRLRDSLWKTHQHDLLNAADIDVSLNALSLLAGNINIRKIGINRARIYLYTDSTGYSNTSLFSRKEKAAAPANKAGQEFEIRKIDFNAVELLVDNQHRFKRFHFIVDELKGAIAYPDTGWKGTIKLRTTIRSFAFNTRKGSFLKDRELKGTLKAGYDSELQQITIAPEKLQIGGDEFRIGAKIDLSKNEAPFEIDIRADAVLYKNLSALLAPNISTKLLKFAIDKPVAVVGRIADDGKKRAADPLITVRMNVKDNIVRFPSGELSSCSFTGTFTNQDTAGRGIGDRNSAIRFYDLKGEYYRVPLAVDTFSITNLERPIASGFVNASFPLERLNEAVGGQTLIFKNGKASVRLFCKMDIEHFKFTKPVFSGNVHITNADITYTPRNMHLVNSNLNLSFNQKNLQITNSRFQLGKSILKMECTIDNFLNFYYTDPEKIVAHVKLNSPMLSLTEFMAFLAPRNSERNNRTRKPAKVDVAAQLDRVFEAAQINIRLQVAKATYKKFVADQLQANVALRKDGIHFDDIRINHAGGGLKLNGSIKPEGRLNRFSLSTQIRRVNVKEFFYAFDNFGQKSITSNHLKGFLSAKINATGSMTDKGAMVARAMHGQVVFNLSGAALVGFEPLQRVQKFAFRNRDFNHITIDNLNGTLTLNGDKVVLSPMQVNTSVLNFNMKGTYGFNEGTDIAMDIPLRNPKKNEGITDKEELRIARMKGIVLHLKAVDDGKGGVKIRWNSDHD